MNNKKKKVLILNGQYLPGFKGGGPIRSAVNIVDNLSDEFDFYVITSDRDYKDDRPYSNVNINEWNRVGNAMVYYMAEENQKINDFERVLKEIDYDIMYLNGYFSRVFTIKPLILRKLKKLRNKNIVLSPRGDFSGGLEIRKVRKKIYIILTKLIGLYKNLTWHSTSQAETDDIKNIFNDANVIEISNLPSKLIKRDIKKNKIKNDAKLVFISRIHPKKNLKNALNMLARNDISGSIEFDIYGPIEDKEYWKECEEIIENIPDNIKVKYKGEVVHSEVDNILKKYHAFLFPTLGENYGHIIVEAMYAGCIPIISDRTPWTSINELNAGWAIPLDDEVRFIKAIESIINFDEEMFIKVMNNTLDYCLKSNDSKKDINKYKKLFNQF